MPAFLCFNQPLPEAESFWNSRSILPRLAKTRHMRLFQNWRRSALPNRLGKPRRGPRLGVRRWNGNFPGQMLVRKALNEPSIASGIDLAVMGAPSRAALKPAPECLVARIYSDRRLDLAFQSPIICSVLPENSLILGQNGYIAAVSIKKSTPTGNEARSRIRSGSPDRLL